MLKNYTPGKLSAFFSQYQSLSFQKGETILRSEDSPQGVYYIKAGFVKFRAWSRCQRCAGDRPAGCVLDRGA